MSGEPLKLVSIADIHLGDQIECRPGTEAYGLLQSFVEKVNSEIKPDFVVDLGDRINDASHDEDIKHAREVDGLLRTINVPRFSCLGNHDVAHLSKSENFESVSSIGNAFYSVIVKGYKLLFIDTVDPVVREGGGHVSPIQLEWLKKEVAVDNYPKIVLGHHPIAEQKQKGNPFFVKLPGQERVDNGVEVLQVLSAGKNVQMYLNGHQHWFYFLLMQGLPLVTVPSFIEAWPKEEGAPGYYCEIELDSIGRIFVQVRGLNPDKVIGCFDVRS